MASYLFEGRKPLIGQGVFVAESALVIGNVQIGKDLYLEMAHRYITPGALSRID